MDDHIEPCGCDESNNLRFWLHFLINQVRAFDYYNVPALEAEEYLYCLENARKTYNK
jgi:hypothetical protein